MDFTGVYVPIGQGSNFIQAVSLSVQYTITASIGDLIALIVDIFDKDGKSGYIVF